MPTAEQLEGLPLLDDFNREELEGIGAPWVEPAWAEWIGSCHPAVGYVVYPFSDSHAAHEGEELPDECAVAVELSNAAEGSGAIEVWLRMDPSSKTGWCLRAEYIGEGVWGLRLTIWFEGIDEGAVAGPEYEFNDEAFIGADGGRMVLAIEGGQLAVFVRPEGGGWEERGGPTGSAELEGLPSTLAGVGVEGEGGVPAIRSLWAGGLEEAEDPETAPGPKPGSQSLLGVGR